MTKKDQGHHKGDHHKDKKGGHQQHIPQQKKAEKQHKKEYDPVYVGSGETKSIDVVYNENLSKKERHMIEKLEAQMEYADAHDNPEEVKKLLERIEAINEKAAKKHKAPHDADVKVIHGGGHKHKEHEEA